MDALDFKNDALNYNKEILISSIVRGGVWLGLECVDAYFNPVELPHLWKKPLYIGVCFGIDVIMCAVSGSTMIGYKKAEDCNYCPRAQASGLANSNVQNWNGVIVSDAVVNPFGIMWLGSVVGLKGTGQAIAPQLPLVAVPNPLNIVGQGVDMVLPNVPVEPLNNGNLITLRNACKLYGISHNIVTASSLLIKDLNTVGWTKPAFQDPTPPSATPPNLDTTKTSSI